MSVHVLLKANLQCFEQLFPFLRLHGLGSVFTITLVAWLLSLKKQLDGDASTNGIVYFRHSIGFAQ